MKKNHFFWLGKCAKDLQVFQASLNQLVATCVANLGSPLRCNAKQTLKLV